MYMFAIFATHSHERITQQAAEGPVFGGESIVEQLMTTCYGFQKMAEVQTEILEKVAQVQTDVAQVQTEVQDMHEATCQSRNAMQDSVSHVVCASCSQAISLKSR
jgi:hypothetical protein